MPGDTFKMRDDFNLHVRALWAARRLGSVERAGKSLGEILRVNFVHAGEIGEVRHEHRAFDDVGERQLLVVENRLHVLQHALGLRLDVAGDRDCRRRVDRNLPGAEQQVADAHGVIVRADGGGRFCGFDDGFRGHGNCLFGFQNVN